jgi:hypothetical protein
MSHEGEPGRAIYASSDKVEHGSFAMFRSHGGNPDEGELLQVSGEDLLLDSDGHMAYDLMGAGVLKHNEQNEIDTVILINPEDVEQE